MFAEYLVFDIETVPLDWDAFSPSQQEYLLRNLSTEEEIEKRKSELGLSPLTAQIACIGLLFIETDGDDEKTYLPVAYAVNNHFSYEQEELIETDSRRIYIVSEKKALEQFWKILKKHLDICLISFNGRNFDSPFLMLRSAILGIHPSRNLMDGTKYNYKYHIDLLDQFTFYQPTNYFSPTKRFNMDFYAHSFGVKSPKTEEINGTKVKEFFKEGKIIEIARYCIDDVVATWELFKKWKKTLQF
ncbi:MAG: ribonuclease H-like domain-containing protein [Ignavibacteria bacterium]|nr:ribonuclease H-like domain-containing protein [Ignavibacteria bacterium]